MPKFVNPCAVVRYYRNYHGRLTGITYPVTTKDCAVDKLFLRARERTDLWYDVEASSARIDQPVDILWLIQQGRTDRYIVTYLSDGIAEGGYPHAACDIVSSIVLSKREADFIQVRQLDD